MTKKAKKIISISIISLVLALTLVVIILAIVPKKHYDPLDTSFNTVTIYKDKSSGMLLSQNSAHKDVIDDILELHEKSLKDNVLSSMFQGTSSYEVKVYRDKTTSFSDICNKSGVYALVFDYGTEGKILKMNGEEYRYTYASASRTITYYRAVLVLTNTTNFEEATLYLINDKDGKQSDCYIKFLAHQSELYDFISDYEAVMPQA